MNNRQIGGSANYTVGYDSLGRITSMTNALCTGTSDFAYGYAGYTNRFASISYPNGQTTSNQYFSSAGDQRLQTITNLGPAASGTLSQFNYTYNADGSIASWTRQTGTNAATAYGLQYDLADQLLTATLQNSGTGGILHQYGYLLGLVFGLRRTCPESFNGLHCYAAGELARFRFFAGHFTLQSCELIPGPKRIFTMLRHPLRRLVSLYNFWRAHTEQIIERDNLWRGVGRGPADMHECFSMAEIQNHPLVNNSMVRTLSRMSSFDPWETYGTIGADAEAMAMLPAAKENLRSMLTFGFRNDLHLSNRHCAPRRRPRRQRADQPYQTTSRIPAPA